MTTRALAPLVQLLRQFRLHRGGTTTDAELLELFISQRDEDAFETLVRRHGPMVLGVCRRILHNEADVEDCFQATFLVLVRKAAALRRRGLVSNWLYGAARKAALKARAMRNLRHRKEKEAGVEKTRMSADHDRDLQELLDQELERLPDKYRAAIVLCDLEGMTVPAAAKEVGCPLGTLSARLVRGRAMLAKRLARHGLAVSGAVLATALCQNAASACVPGPLVISTVQAATLLVAGKALVTGMVSAKVAALMEGVLKAMLLTKLKNLAIVLVLFVGLGGAATVYRTVYVHADPSPETATPQVPKPPQDGQAESPDRGAARPDHAQPPQVPPAKDPAVQADPPAKAGQPVAGKLVAALGAKKFFFPFPVRCVAYSPDGKLLAVSEVNTIHLLDAATKNQLRTLGGSRPAEIYSLAFSPDGKVLAVGDRSADIYQLEVATGKSLREFAGHPLGTYFITFSPDGKLLATVGEERPPREEQGPPKSFEPLVDRGPRRQYSVGIWDAKTGTKSAAYTCQTFPTLPRVFAFSPDCKLFAQAVDSGLVQVTTLSDGKEVFTSASDGMPIVKSGSIRALDFSSDSKILAVGGSHGIGQFDLASGKWVLQTLVDYPKDGQVAFQDCYHVARFSPDGKILGSISDAGIALWDVESGKLTGIVKTYGPRPETMTFRPDGKKLAAASYTVSLWDVATGKEECAEDGHREAVGAVAVSPDSKVVVTASSDSVRFWDRATGKELRQLPIVPREACPYGFDGSLPYEALVYGSNGLLMLGVAKDQLFHLYDTDTGKEKGTLDKYMRARNCRAVSADGKLLAAVFQIDGKSASSNCHPAKRRRIWRAAASAWRSGRTARHWPLSGSAAL